MIDRLRRGALAISLAAPLLASPLAAQQLDIVESEPREPASPRGWTVAWTVDLSRGASAAPVWADSMLLVASLDRNVHLVRLEPEPDVEWKENFKGGFRAPPVVTEDRIYLAETRRGERLLAIDRRTHAVEWTADAGDAEATPLVTHERIYTVSSIGDVKAWARLTGAAVWEAELETRIVADPVLLDDRLVLAASDGILYALDPDTGRILESIEAEAGPIWGDPLVYPSRDAASRAIYASLEGHVIEVDRDLEIVQRRTFPASFYAGPSAGSGDRVYLAGHDGTLWAYDWGTAEITWTAEVGVGVRMAPVEGEDVVAVGDLGGTLHVLDVASGMTLWSERLDDAITAPPVLRGSRVYAITERGTLYAFRPVHDET